MTGGLALVAAVCVFFGLLGVYGAVVVDRRAIADEQSDKALLRELSRHHHPSTFETDWTPPHGLERPER